MGFHLEDVICKLINVSPVFPGRSNILLNHIINNTKLSLNNLYNPYLRILFKYILEHTNMTSTFPDMPNVNQNLDLDLEYTPYLVYKANSGTSDYTIIDNNILNILVSDNFIMLFDKLFQQIVCFRENKFLIINQQTIFINITHLADHMCSVSSLIYDAHTINHIIAEACPNYEHYYYNYTDKLRNNHIINMTNVTNTNGKIEHLEKTIKNNNHITYYTDGDYEKLFAKCVISTMQGGDGAGSGGGIKYGTYTALKTSDNKIYKKIIQDDNIIYKKSDNKIIIDTISPPITSRDMVIGWKVGKSNLDYEVLQLRIIKLGIPYDARRLIPISEDYFASCRKERCDRAFVLDIQEPNLDEQITVVPKEKLAKSYIYDKITYYKVGELVLPDGFSDNPDSSCDQGIHYHRDRRAVFKMWIPGYEDIKYEY
jgi:hypothetical protein